MLAFIFWDFIHYRAI